MSQFQRVQQWATFSRIWHIYDAKWQNPFDSANLIVKYLKGLNKPIYHALNDCGDHVVVINTKQIALPGDHWTKQVYFHHEGKPGTATWTLAWELHAKDPTLILQKAVYRTLRSSLQRRGFMMRLHLYPDEEVPKDILENVSNQIRPLRPVPKRLDHYSPEEVKNFPKIFDYPENYIKR